MSLFRPQQDFDKPKLGEEFYAGIVVDNNDPDQLNRVKIRIKEIHGTEQDIPDDNLPWAIQFRPTLFGGDSELSLSSVPRIGSQIIVTHIRGDVYQPAYVFELHHNKNKIDQSSQNYPDSYVLKDSDENFWHVDLINDKLDIKFNGSECLYITVDRDTIIGQNDHEIIQGNKIKEVLENETNTVTGTRDTEITGNESKTVHSNQNNTIDLDRVEDIGNNLVQTVGTGKTVTVPTLTINSSTKVILNSPSVEVNSGTITVSGGDVIADGISLKTHTHISAPPGVPTGPPI